ncbi:PEPxxWA-CTERM sorting domain-containing protein [Duganella margarita]|nr:PEPxxWA-CTERM sorting domain-containing protein [Duganella margarita]
MSVKHLFSSFGLVAFTAFVPVAHAASSGTVYFDLAGLTSAFQRGTDGFSGWQYQSSGTALSGSVSDVKTLNSPDMLATAGSATTLTHAGRLSVETGSGGASQGYQQLTTSVQLAPGQHFSYAVAFTMVMHKEVPLERVDLGAGFIIDSQFDGYSVDKTVSTLDWKGPLGTVSESSVFEIELYNPYDTTVTYNVSGWLGAADSSPASAVPEPATYAMLLLGLGMLGAAARRRQA